MGLFVLKPCKLRPGARDFSKVMFFVYRVPLSPDQMVSSLRRESSCLLMTVSAMGWAGGYGQGGK